MEMLTNLVIYQSSVCDEAVRNLLEELGVEIMPDLLEDDDNHTDKNIGEEVIDHIIDMVTNKPNMDTSKPNRNHEEGKGKAINTGKRVAYSMDVTALYPSITAKQAGEAVKRAIDTTTLTIANINFGMALRYIAKNAKDNAEVKSWGMEKWCPVRTKIPGPRPGFTGASLEDDKWTEGQVPYDTKSRKKIVGKVLELAIVKIFKSNVYKCAGKTYLQTDGAPIGLDLSGEVGRLVMALFDVDFMEKCCSNHIDIDLNARYVDDDDLVQSATPMAKVSATV